MGYGLGVFLLALGLILAFAVQDALDAVDLTMMGYILAACGLLVIVLTAVQANRGRPAHHSSATTHPPRRLADHRRASARTTPGPAARGLTCANIASGWCALRVWVHCAPR